MAQDPRYDITWLIRRLFRAMGTAADAYLRHSGMTAADRAVMEFLYPGKALSVPDIAALYDVSRQHVQSTVNSLLDKGLAVAQDNPRHRRSPLIALTDGGRDTFAEIRRNEDEFIDTMFAGIASPDVDITRNTLHRLWKTLKEIDHGD